MDVEKGKHSPMKKSMGLMLAIITLIVGLFILGIIPRISQNKKIEAIANEDTSPHVTLMTLKHNIKPIELSLPSSAQALHYTPIWARVNGYLIRYLADIGDAVKKGDLLAEIDTPETDQQLAQAKADLLNATVERDIAKITSERWQNLWNKNQEAVSKQEVDQYGANLGSTEAMVVANTKNVERLTYQQKFKYIYAPFDGVITKRHIDNGTLIYGSINGTPQELFEIVDTSIIRFFVEVPQTYYTEIKDNIRATVTISQLANEVFEGHVVRFAKGLNPLSRTMLTQVDVDNKNGSIYPGVYGQVNFFMTPSVLSFVIPTTSVIIRSSSPTVAIVDENNIVHLQPVKIGHDFGNQMEIISGLKENDRLVKIPNDKILEGVKVVVIDSSSIKK